MSYMRFDLTPTAAADQTVIEVPARRPGMLQQLAAIWGRWRRNARDRHALARLDARSLHDVGLSKAMVEYELNQPRWQPLRDWRF